MPDLQMDVYKFVDGVRLAATDVAVEKKPQFLQPGIDSRDNSEANYAPESNGIMNQELTKKIRSSFIAGIREPLVRSRLLSCDANNLADLLSEALVAQATLWRGEDPKQSNVFFNETTPTGDDSVANLVAAVQQLLRKPEANSILFGQPTKDKIHRIYGDFPHAHFVKNRAIHSVRLMDMSRGVLASEMLIEVLYNLDIGIKAGETRRRQCPEIP
ncbi:hypothetical protein BC826DRAFT_976759 [Russula brevipes]|nr:hypothetical protein BC826DRAFT_976759 [Russula brevipes]